MNLTGLYFDFTNAQEYQTLLAYKIIKNLLVILPLWPKRGGPTYNNFPFTICIKRAQNYIESQVIYILRFENTEVNKDIEYVRYIINNVCEARQNGIPIMPDYR